MVGVERARITVQGAVLRVAVHRPARPRGAALLLIPGAGGGLDTEGLVALAEVAAAGGHPTVRAELPHHATGRPPPPAHRSVPVLVALLAAVRSRWGPRRRWVVGGKSYGARVATLAAAAGGLDAAALLLYGYPLHPPGRTERLRTDHWPEVRLPVLLLQGSDDPFADPTLLEREVARFGGPVSVRWVRGGDHSLGVPARRAPDGRRRRPSDSIRALAADVVAFLDG